MFVQVCACAHVLVRNAVTCAGVFAPEQDTVSTPRVTNPAIRCARRAPSPLHGEGTGGWLGSPQLGLVVALVFRTSCHHLCNIVVVIVCLYLNQTLL